MIDWLRKIDWSQQGSDLSVVRMPAPDGSIVILTKDGDSSNFGFYWDGGFIKDNHLIRGGDMAQLRQILTRACQQKLKS